MQKTPNQLPLPLPEGIKVLELSRVLAGPWAGQLLADMGADVIKVERPHTGDESRSWGPPFAKDKDGSPLPLESAYYLSTNRGKRSIVADISSPTGQEVVQALAARSDILIENYKVGGLRKYGLDYESLHQLNPRLIYCSITGFGQNGPLAKRSGYDLMIQAMGGLMSITGEARCGPQKVGVAVVDLMTGVYAVVAILAALHQRHLTGTGQHLDAALFDVALAMLANQAANYLIGGTVPDLMDSAHPNIVPYQRFSTLDSFVVIGVGNDQQFSTLCRLIGLSPLAEDQRFSSNAARVHHRGELIPILERVVKQHKTDDLVRLLEEANIPCAPVRSLDQVFSDPQVLSRDMVVAFDHPRAGSIRTVSQPVKFSAATAKSARVPPLLGEHTEEILQELGYDQKTIQRIRKELCPPT